MSPGIRRTLLTSNLSHCWPLTPGTEAELGEGTGDADLDRKEGHGFYLTNKITF